MIIVKTTPKQQTRAYPIHCSCKQLAAEVVGTATRLEIARLDMLCNISQRNRRRKQQSSYASKYSTLVQQQNRVQQSLQSQQSSCRTAADASMAMAMADQHCGLRAVVIAIELQVVAHKRGDAAKKGSGVVVNRKLRVSGRKQVRRADRHLGGCTKTTRVSLTRARSVQRSY